jgi:PAS domain S-box-containing protein
MAQAPVRILWIEDDSDFTLLMQKSLHSIANSKFQLEFARELQAGIRRLGESEYDVILLDLNLRDSSGIQTLSKLYPHARNIPIIVLTGAYDEALGTKALQTGAQDYLVKGSFDHDTLMRTIRYAIERMGQDEQLRSILASITSILIGLDSQNRITHWNEICERTFGIPAEQAIHKPFEECGIQWDFKRVLESISECRREDRTVRLDDLVFREADGKDGFIGLTINPIKGRNREQSGVLIFGADITERKRLEEDVRQMQKMESLGTLAGGIAHDFKNILGPILGYSELAKRSLSKESKDFERLSKVVACVHRANQLVKQILVFSRKSGEKKRPVSLIAIVNEVLNLLKEVLPPAIEVNSKLDPAAGAIFADSTQIHQVLMNLCMNASYAMREGGGKLEVCVEPVQIGEAFVRMHPELRLGPYVKLTVKDTGEGILPEVLPRIFEPFFTTKPEGEGNGMGLAAVYGIVKSHEGTITAASEVGKGSTFEVYFPKAQAVFYSDEVQDADLPRGTERILVVDDKQDVVDVTVELLDSLGYAVEKSTRSDEAYERFRQNPDRFDLVITDQAMPKMTGTKLIRAIRSVRPETPAILCTGCGDLRAREEAEALGIKEYLEKPISMGDFARSIRRALDSKPAIC